MRKLLRITFGLAVLVFCVPVLGQSPSALKTMLSGAGPGQPEKKFEDFDKVVKGAKEYDGLFRLHHKDEHLYAEIRPDQFDKPLLCPIAIARGMAMGGYTLNFDEQWVLVFRRVGDKVHLVRRNVRFQAKKDSPVAKAVETTYTDSVLKALKIRSINPKGQTVLIDLNDIFMEDFANLRWFGSFDANRSTWHKVKAFSKNIELEVAATYSRGGGYWFFGDDSVIDPRGNTVVLHYGLVQLPEGGYQPRLADDRVGYFLSVTKDFSSDSKDTSFLRHVNRWRLERADADPRHKNRLSPPKKRIVFWIEKSVPHEYRPYVRDGILEWNKAFEKVGFRDAIEVRQQENEDFDPEDINYNTFRWITTSGAFAMGPSRANPFTGELLDADIIFDADLVRYWKQEYRLFGGGAPGMEEPASTIQAIRQGWGLMHPRLSPRGNPLGWDDRDGRPRPPGAPRSGVPPAADPRARLFAAQQGFCQCANCMKYELGLAAMTLAAREDKPDDKKPGDKSADKDKDKDKVPEELIGQAIKMVVMHEVGHTLGLRHNFKASTMLKNEQLHDTSITRKVGLSGSVMDYLPVNLAPKGTKQGDYFTTTIGPYDYWAIEYAYKPLAGGTEGEYEKLKEIANRGARPGHDYGTDEDLFGTPDPLIHAFDLGADPMKFAQDRMLLAEELMQDLADRVVDKGEGYQRARQAFSLLLNQFGNAAYLVSSFVGGEHVHRDHRGDPGARDPFIPVKAHRQRQALKFLEEHILTDKPFQFSPKVLRRLAADRWYHWGNEYAVFSGVEFPLYSRILGIQRVVLGQLLDAGTLSRIQNNALKAEEEEPLAVAEVFRSLTDSIWADLPAAAPRVADPKVASGSIIRRNLQREHLKDLTNLVLGERRDDRFIFYFFFYSPPAPPDAKSLARMHLRQIGQRVEAVLKDKNGKLDDTTRAHLEECHERITKVLNASMQVNEP